MATSGEVNSIIVSCSDDQPLVAVQEDISGGINSRVNPLKIQENQCESLQNVDIGDVGLRSKILGSVMSHDTPLSGAVPLLANFTSMFNFTIDNEADQLLVYSDNGNLYKSTNQGALAEISTTVTKTQEKVGFILGKESGLTPDNVVFICDGVNNVERLSASGDCQDLGNTNTSPPITTVGAWFNNRLWMLKNGMLYFSDAYSADYSGAFDRSTEAYRVPVGEERGIAVTRDLGLVIIGSEAIMSLSPSSTPAATDKPEMLLANIGCLSKQGWCYAGDDVYFFTKEGLRALKRNVEDKLQLGATYPTSYQLKAELTNIDWSKSGDIHMIHFDNKLYISIPQLDGTWNTWIYYLASGGFSLRNNTNPIVRCAHTINSQDRLYYAKSGTAKIYREEYGYTTEGTDQYNGTTIEMIEESKKFDFGAPLTYKNGGEIEIQTSACDSSSYLEVWVSLDDNDYELLGTINTPATTVLPIDLPFTLQGFRRIIKKFHLDRLGRFRNLQVKLIEEGSTSEIPKIYSTYVLTYNELLEDEY